MNRAPMRSVDHERGQPLSREERMKRYRDEDEAHDAAVQRKDDAAELAAIQAKCQHVPLRDTHQCRKCGLELGAADQGAA